MARKTGDAWVVGEKNLEQLLLAWSVPLESLTDGWRTDYPF